MTIDIPTVALYDQYRFFRKMKHSLLLVFLMGLSSTFSTVRADLRQQYANFGCIDYYEFNVDSRYIHCIDGNNIVYWYDPELKRIVSRRGKIGHKKIFSSNTRYGWQSIMHQFYIEDGSLIRYSCVESEGQCSSDFNREAFRKLDDI